MSKKESIKTKQAAEAAPINSEFDLNDQLAVEPALITEITEQGLVYRWINAAKFKQSYGFDARRWQPYKRKSEATGAFGFTDSEGYTRRGDLILAVRSVAINEAHKAKIANKNKTMAAAQNKQAAEELRQRMKDAGIKGAKIHEGWEDND